MKRDYYAIHIGENNQLCDYGRQEELIGFDEEININLSDYFSENFYSYHQQLVSIYLKNFPHKNRGMAKIICEKMCYLTHFIKEGDYIITPLNNPDHFIVGTICGPYTYSPHQLLPHQRPVQWIKKSFPQSSISTPFLKKILHQESYSTLNEHREEIEVLIDSHNQPQIVHSQIISTLSPS